MSPAQPPRPDASRSGADHTGRLALSKDDAAECIGISVDTFERHVMPTLRVVRVGESSRARVIVPVSELERYLEREAALPVGGERL